MILGGEIDTFLATLDSSPRNNNAAHMKAMLLLNAMFEEKKSINPNRKNASFWCFYDTGTVFLWNEGVLMSVTWYLQGYPEIGYQPYPRRLFDAFPNDATQADVEKALGKPDTTGNWGGPWIRYDNVNGNWLHFEFDDDGKLWTTSISTPLS